MENSTRPCPTNIRYIRTTFCFARFFFFLLHPLLFKRKMEARCILSYMDDSYDDMHLFVLVHEIYQIKVRSLFFDNLQPAQVDFEDRHLTLNTTSYYLDKEILTMSFQRTLLWTILPIWCTAVKTQIHFKRFMCEFYIEKIRCYSLLINI